MELDDVNLKPYKNLNPYLDDNLSRNIYEPSNSSEIMLSGKDIDSIIAGEYSLGNTSNVYVDPIKGDEISDQKVNTHFDNFAKQILFSGADFAKNFFDTFLFAVKHDGNQTDAFNELATKSKENENKLPNLWRTVGMYSFTTRTTKIEIPQPKAQTFDYTNGQYVVRKIKSEWEMPKKSSLTMRIDGLAYYIDAINLLSQNSDNADLSDQRGIDHLSFMGFNKHLAENLKSGTHLDLVVRHTNPNDEGLKNAWLKNAERLVYRQSATYDTQDGMVNVYPDNAHSMFWVFEDVKFLGWNDGLEFGHNSTGSQELTTDFIFKRLIRVDPMYLENYVGGTARKAFELTDIKDSAISDELKIKSNFSKV